MIRRVGIFFCAALLGAWLLVTGVVDAAFLAGLGFAAGIFALVLLGGDGPAWGISFLLPVTILTNFADIPLSSLPLLETPRSVYLLMLCLALGARHFIHGRPVKIPSHAKPLLVFLGILLLTVPFSQNLFKSLAFFIKNFFLMGTLFIFALEVLEQPRGRKIFGQTLMCLVTLVFIFGLYQFFTQSLGLGEELRNQAMMEEIKRFQILRVPSFFASPYAASEFYFLLIPFIMVRSEESSGFDRSIWRLWIGLLIVGVLLTQQRSGVLIILFQVVAFKVLEKPGDSFKRFFKTAILLLIVGSLGIFVLSKTSFGQGMFERMQATFSATSVEDMQDAGSTLVRLQRMFIAWLIFQDHIITGVGIGMSPFIYPAYGWNWLQFDGGAHNVFLYLLSESGILGLIGFIYWFRKFFRIFARRLVDSAGSDRAFWAGCLVFGASLLLDGLFSGLWGYPSLIFIALGFAYMHSRPPAKPAAEAR